MEEKKIAKQISNSLKPLLIGLRNEIKKTNKRIQDLIEKAPPAIQKTTESNPVKSLKIANFPKAQDLTPIQKEIQEIKVAMGERYKVQRRADLKAREADTKWYKKFATRIFKVKVENQIKLPKTVNVKVENQIELPDVGRTFIENRSPDEAIPVVLTGKQRKAFYNVITSIGGGVNLSNVSNKLDEIKTVLENLTIVVPAPNPRPGRRIAEFLKNAGSEDLNVDGSTTSVTFSASPPTGKKWFIHSVALIIEDGSINFTKFGGIPGGLTNGVEFRVKEGGLAEITLGTFKTNGDFHIFTVDIRLDSAVTDFLTIDANIKENTGTTLELANANSEIFKVIVNDNLTPLTRFNVLIKGFELDE